MVAIAEAPMIWRYWPKINAGNTSMTEHTCVAASGGLRAENGYPWKSACICRFSAQVLESPPHTPHSSTLPLCMPLFSALAFSMESCWWEDLYSKLISSKEPVPNSYQCIVLACLATLYIKVINRCAITQDTRDTNLAHTHIHAQHIANTQCRTDTVWVHPHNTNTGTYAGGRKPTYTSTHPHMPNHGELR